MADALINHVMLRWARNRAGISLEELRGVHKKYEQWESGSLRPTFKQAQALAKRFHIPFGYLYLAEPPVEQTKVKDLRTVKSKQHGAVFSPELTDVINDALRKQAWYKEYLLENKAKPLSFVGRYTVKTSVQTVAANIIKTLKIAPATRSKVRKEGFLHYLTEKAEDAGILVLRSGKVGNNTRRTLDPEEFRGFALPDEYAPLVFINSRDYDAARVFTLAHELAHIWLGAEGVSNAPLNEENHRQIERFCNQVAAAVLVPEKEFMQQWGMLRNPTLKEYADTLAKEFKVSSAVIARRALDLKFIKKSEFNDYYKMLVGRWKNTSAHKNAKSRGGDFYKGFNVANSKRLIQAVCSEVAAGRELIRNGAQVLGASPKVLVNCMKTEGAP